VAQKANLSFENGFPYISVIYEASDFEFGMQLQFAKAHNKIPLEEKSGCGPGLGELPEIWGSPIIFLQPLGLATSNLSLSWSLPRPILKSHVEERGHEGKPPNYGELP